MPIKSSAVKLRDAFTYDDDGKYIPLDKRSDAGNPDIRYSIGEGDYFNKARNELPIDKDSKPNLLDVSGTDAELFQRAEKTFESMPMFTRAADGVKIKLKVSEGGSMAARVVHMISNNSTGIIDVKKLAWLPNIQGTIENAQVRLKGRYDTRKQGRHEPNRIYIRRYGDGTIHAVVVSPYGEIVGQDIKSANVITQYPVERIGEIYNAKVDWVNPKMTEAPISKTEASHINDLSHQGTVPLPKANGSTSKGSMISDSRRLSMLEESETSRESQAKIDEIKSAVEEVLTKFNRRAKIKSDVSVVGTLEDARGVLGAESIPYNARAVQDKEKVVIIAENIADSDEAVRIFLHEQVGHWGLRKLLKADFRPFLNYLILNYKGSEAWNRIAKYYGNVASDKYAIAEEMLAHIAENRDVSDPSMWKRLVHRVKRALWGNGVPPEYVNLLNEDVLRSAIALSREWAKGDHYLNANGIWAKIDSAPKGRDVPDESDDGKRFSLIGEKGMRNLENIGSENTSNPESAKEMLARGETPSNIWRKTGWFKNPKDGKWRYELDNGEIINAPFEENSNQLLPNVLDDSELYLAYPNLRDRWVAFRNIANGGAYFDGKNFYVDNSFTDNPKGLREILIHEIQHFIQIEEDFARGANEGMFTSENSKFLNWKIEEVSREYDELQAEKKRVFKESGLSDKIRAIADDEDFVEKYEKLLAESGVKEVLAELDDKIFKKGDELWKLQEERNNEETGLSPHEKYMRVAGEVEARNAAARQRKLSPDMRRKIFPEATQDIPFDEQIVRRNDGVSYSLKEEAEDSDAEKINRQFRELYEHYKSGDKGAASKREWENSNFAQQVDNYAKGNYPSGKFFTVGTPSALLKSFGIPNKKIVMTEGVLKKIKAHGLSDAQIKQIPETINAPVGIFAYPKNESVFDVLVEMHMDDGRPIIVSLEINKTRQGVGEITDLLTAHPKENFGRIIDWAKKGRCKYWDKQKGRKLLQDTIPANWERYETELTPYLPLQSEIDAESQGKYRFSLDEKTDEKYDGRYGRASRKYQKLRAKKQKELGRAIEYEQLPDLTTDAEFKSEVGMSKVRELPLLCQ